ncbi:MAG TPA: YqhA family protein [Acetobacteraceae bacterium]|nr:YqhA family protein [Acetobacteraceae bacterium]
MPEQDIPARLTHALGRMVFAARWLMAPIYVGLLAGLLLLVIKFVQNLVAVVPNLLQMSGADTVLAVLGLVDLSLVANLVLIVVLAGWQGFVDPLLGSHLDDRPAWLALDFSAIKLKLIGSIAVIAAIAMLESFTHVESLSPDAVTRQLAILLAIGVLGVLLAAMDRLGHTHTKE